MNLQQAANSLIKVADAALKNPHGGGAAIFGDVAVVKSFFDQIAPLVEKQQEDKEEVKDNG